jgi:sugar phosphate isomerase/epimerase
MRVCGASLMFRNDPHGPMLQKLARMFREAVKTAAAAGVKIADENHIDFTADEMLSLITAVDSPYFGINFDTGNFMRVLDDPIKGMQKLAKYTLSTHVKDLKPNREAAVDDWYFFSSTPVGDGLVDNQKLAQLLKDAGYTGFLAVEIDNLHPDYKYDEDKAVAQSVKELRRIADSVG